MLKGIFIFLVLVLSFPSCSTVKPLVDKCADYRNPLIFEFGPEKKLQSIFIPLESVKQGYFECRKDMLVQQIKDGLESNTKLITFLSFYNIETNTTVLYEINFVKGWLVTQQITPAISGYDSSVEVMFPLQGVYDALSDPKGEGLFFTMVAEASYTEEEFAALISGLTDNKFQLDDK